MRLITACAFLLAIATAVVPAARAEQAGSIGLDPRIGPAKPSKYRGINDAAKFRNPYVGVGADDIIVNATGLAPGGQRVSANELSALIRALPVRAWPYGRVIWASDTGLHPADLSDTDSIRANHEAVEKVMKALDVRVEWLPSA